MAKTLIKNGLVVNSTGTGAADVLIDGETIVADKQAWKEHLEKNQ